MGVSGKFSSKTPQYGYYPPMSKSAFSFLEICSTRHNASRPIAELESAAIAQPTNSRALNDVQRIARFTTPVPEYLVAVRSFKFYLADKQLDL